MAADQDRLNSIYDLWAQDYERDLWASGNPYVAMIAGFAVRHIPDRRADVRHWVNVYRKSGSRRDAP